MTVEATSAAWRAPSDAALRLAHRRLEAGLASNAAGRPRGAARHFRSAVRALVAHGADAPVGADCAVDAPRTADGPGSAEDLAPAGRKDAAYVRARASLGLAMSEYELTADVDAALAGLDEAERWAGEAGAPAVSVAILGQRGLILMRAGRTVEALASLDRGVARLDAAEPVDACCLLLNRGTLRLDLGHLPEARSDLRACADRADALGDPLLTFKARHNLGYLEYLAGDLPLALATMADAAALDHGASPAVALLDRAQVLLEAGLVSDAEASLLEAASLFAGQRLAHDLAETELALARCALLQHHPGLALERARAARRRFARRGNEDWAARAEVLEVRSRLAVALDSADPSTRALTSIASAAESLARRLEAWPSGTTPHRDRARSAWATAAEALAEAGRPDAARAHLARAGRLTGEESLSLAVQVRLVRARVAFAVGARPTGVRNVRAGQALLADHRRHLGSMEALTAAAVHGRRLAEVDVAAALREGRPAAVLDAVERARAPWAGPARVRLPADPDLADLLTRLRRCLELDRLLAPSSTPANLARRADLRREAADLRAALRERSWQVPGVAGAPEPTTAAALSAALRRAGSEPVAVVDYLAHRGTVYAVTARAQGLALHRLGGLADVHAALSRLGADLAVLANPLLPPPLRAVASASLERVLAGLDEALLAPLAVSGPVHVVAPGALAGLPWGQLPSRTGQPTSVSTRLVLGPAGREGPAGRGSPSPGEDDDGAAVRPGAVAVAGPRLRHAEAEAEAVAAAWGSGRVASGPDATCAAVVAALRDSPVVHLATHGRHEPDNPVFSSLHLADGPLFAHELDGLRLPRSLVVLSACEVGQVSEAAGGEALGLAGVLVRLGARAVVAAVAPLRDDVAAVVMPALHAEVAAGIPPAQALTRACSRIPDLVPLVCLTEAVPGL